MVNPDLESGVLRQVFIVTPGTRNWASGGPYGGHTRYLAINPENPQIVYVTVDNAGLFRTENGGETWEEIFYSPDGYNTVRLSKNNPNSVYFSAADALYRSDQQGDPGSWVKIPYPVGISGSVPRVLQVAPGPQDILYGAFYYNVFYSQDGGVTWKDISVDHLGDNKVLAVDFQHPDIAYLAYKTLGTVYRTSNAGNSWTKLASNKGIGTGSLVLRR